MMSRARRVGVERVRSPRRQPPIAPASAEGGASSASRLETGRGREHGDSYSDVQRDEDLIGTASSHTPRPDRSPEEPSEPVVGAGERLEGSL